MSRDFLIGGPIVVLATVFFAFIGTTELMVLGGILVLLFGGAKLPKLARSLGQSFVEFKKGVKGEDDDTPLPGSDTDPKLPNDGEKS